MIRLRETLDRACRHRWLGPLVMILLVVLIAFLALHEGGEKLFDSAGELCVALAAVALSLARGRLQIVGRLSPGALRRGLALARAAPLVGPVPLEISPAPLRL